MLCSRALSSFKSSVQVIKTLPDTVQKQTGELRGSFKCDWNVVAGGDEEKRINGGKCLVVVNLGFKKGKW